jgi:hypothetical protein
VLQEAAPIAYAETDRISGFSRTPWVRGTPYGGLPRLLLRADKGIQGALESFSAPLPDPIGSRTAARKPRNRATGKPRNPQRWGHHRVRTPPPRSGFGVPSPGESGPSNPVPDSSSRRACRPVKSRQQVRRSSLAPGAAAGCRPRSGWRHGATSRRPTHGGTDGRHGAEGAPPARAMAAPTMELMLVCEPRPPIAAFTRRNSRRQSLRGRPR